MIDKFVSSSGVLLVQIGKGCKLLENRMQPLDSAIALYKQIIPSYTITHTVKYKSFLQVATFSSENITSEC